MMSLPPAATAVPGASSVPDAVHHLKHSSSVLALAVSPQHDSIYAGTQDGEIAVWSLATFHQVQLVQAHKRSVLSLVLAPDASLLFSSAGDAIINAWCPRTMRRLYEIYGRHDVGDVFCTAYSAQLETLYLGAQNTTIQWICLGDPAARAPPDSRAHPDRRNHRFFDSKAVGGSSTPRRSEDRWGLIPRAGAVLEMHAANVKHFAHYGYVYCMLVARSPTVEVDADEDVLISGGGDGTIKLWSLRRHDPSGDPDHHGGGAGGIEEIMTLGSDNAESVLSLALDGSFLYAGKLDGIVELWDLDTAQRLRVIKVEDRDIMSLQMRWGCLWTASANGLAHKFSTAHYGKYQHVSRNVSQKYQCLSRWRAHDGKILASVCATYNHEHFFITGANDHCVSVWHVADEADPQREEHPTGSDNVLLSTLAEFVSYRTVSSRPEFAEDCRKGATFLGALFKRMGAQTEMLSTERDHNPIVFARFCGKKESESVSVSESESEPEPGKRKRRILFYGHYDVVAADNRSGKWATDPFAVRGTNGFLYGRGVSDNKGPIIAALYAVADLMQAQELENDVIFLIEGEEESRSRGFEEVVRLNRELIGHVDYVLLANSYWLDDEVPCLTYGLRGVLHATVSVDSARPDTHSGVDGSHMLDEPLSDLTAILARLKGRGNRVLLPGFYDGIPAVTPAEEARYDDIASILVRRRGGALPEADIKRSLLARWREPNLTIHRYKVSGPDGSLVSSHASSNISVRLVPGQEVDSVAAALRAFLEREFAALASQNRLSVQVDNKAEPWLGDPTNAIFRTLETAVVEAWPDCFGGGGAAAAAARGSPDSDGSDGSGSAAGKPRRPLYIREGGSIPAIRFLEKEFGAPAAHLPCGRASDAAHLDNERMSIVNLIKAREIFGKVFARL